MAVAPFSHLLLCASLPGREQRRPGRRRRRPPPPLVAAPPALRPVRPTSPRGGPVLADVVCCALLTAAAALPVAIARASVGAVGAAAHSPCGADRTAVACGARRLCASATVRVRRLQQIIAESAARTTYLRDSQPGCSCILHLLSCLAAVAPEQPVDRLVRTVLHPHLRTQRKRHKTQGSGYVSVF